MTFCLSSRYSNYLYLCYVTVGKPTFTKMLSSSHLLRALFVRVGRRDHHLTLYRCYSPMTSKTRLCYITDCTCVLCPYSQVATVSNPFLFWFVTFVIYSFLSLLCDLSTPILCVFPHPFILTIDSFGCQELALSLVREGKIQPYGSA